MSTPRLTPYLTFNGNCRQAMAFYQQCLGGELMVQTFEGTPAAEHVAPEALQNVMHSALTTADMVLMASDSGLGPVAKGDMISLSVNCQSPEEIQRLFSLLSAGGTITMPLQDTFWGATFGMFADQFGIDWMLNYDKPQ
ncbi:VOC family protein [Hymenobacter lutimineralis]|uniref:VOC family protein n=1 Tax=Hymenobacter lutimineralis TaxID=2606448 RepID=A0A5D6V9N2_9BACT|nr:MULTISPECIES: VOC family protein [Hymenobacter]QIX61903.1 VOC family protein [Hymenobacter sp. BT18]TYZ12593.1 VOC family protein [Hymenobacter lutimineralis]